MVVLSPEEFARIQQDRLFAVKDDLKKVKDLQEKAKKDVEKLVSTFAMREGSTTLDRTKITYAEHDQRRITGRLKRITEDLREILEEMKRNKIGEKADYEWLGEIGDAVSELAESRSPTVVGNLTALRKQKKPDKSLLALIPHRQDDILAVLADILRRLDRWGDFNEALRELRDLLRDEQSVHKDTVERTLKKTR